MAHSLQAKKRIRQGEKRRIYNKSIKSEIRTLTKSFLASVERKDRDSAGALLTRLVSRMDKAGRKRIYHPNTVARKKSQVTKLFNGLSSAGSA